MRNLIFSFLLLALCPFLLCAHFYRPVVKDDIEIHIHAITAMVTNGEYKIDIYKTGTQIKIVYSLLDSVEYRKLRKDKFYIKLKKYYDSITDKSGGLGNDSIKKYYSQIMPLYNHYKLYSRDSITMSTVADTAYNNLLSNVVLTNNWQFEKMRRNVLDGTSFTYQITVQGITRTVQADNPTKTSYPLLYALVEHSIQVYRNKKNNTFLNAKRMLGY